MYTYELTAAQQVVMDAKAAQSSTKEKTETVEGLIDFKIAEFIAACARDVGQDLDTRLAKALAKQDAATKETLLSTLEAA